MNLDYFGQPSQYFFFQPGSMLVRDASRHAIDAIMSQPQGEANGRCPAAAPPQFGPPSSKQVSFRRST